MARKLAEFIEDFVLPLHAGGALGLGDPLGLGDVESMMQEGGELLSGELQLARDRASQLWMAEQPPPDSERSDLLLWAAVHNILILDHPDRERVWARSRIF